MAFGSMDAGGDDEQLAEINMVPLIDVMLVLLIIFMVTAPLLTHSVGVELPQASSTPTVVQPKTLELAIDREGRYFLDGQPAEEEALKERLAEAGRAPEPPTLNLRADRAVDYGKVATVMSWAASAGVTKLGFVTEPAPQ